MRCNRHKLHHKSLIDNTKAVIDLPMRLMVMLIIGVVSLAAILSFLVQPGFIDPDLTVRINPYIIYANQTNTLHQFSVTITNDEQKPVANAHVIFQNQDDVVSNSTDQTGTTTLLFNSTTEFHRYESFINVNVKAQNYQDFHAADLIKIIYR